MTFRYLLKYYPLKELKNPERRWEKQSIMLPVELVGDGATVGAI